MRVLLVVEDEPDIRMLVRFRFGLDPDFELDGDAADIPAAVEAAARSHPDLIILDHKLEGEVTGLDGAPLLKGACPAAKIILFSASQELRIPATTSPHIDAFLMKTDFEELIPLGRRLLGLGP